MIAMRIKRPALWALIFTIGGIYIRLGISKEICLAFFIFILLCTSQFVINKDFKMAATFIVMAILGFFLAGNSVKTTFVELEGKTLMDCRGVVFEEGTTSSGNQKLFVRLQAPFQEGQNKTVVLYAIWTEGDFFQIGDEILISGEVLPLEGKTVPGGYDERLYLKTKSVDYKIYPERIQKIGKSNDFSVKLQEIKEQVFAVFDTVLPQRESGILKAMVTGEKDDLDQETRELYIKAGINHILCVSGLHVSIFVLMVHFIIEKCLKQSKRTGALITIACCMGFLIFTGFSPSSVRAVIMITVALLGRVFFRRSDMLNNVAIAALFLLLFQPLYLWNAGFQLSFITVMGIWMGLQVVANDTDIMSKMKRTFILSLYASLFSYPLVAYHFFNISLIGIFLNLFILPLCAPLLFFAFLTAIGGLIFPPIAAISAGGAFGILKFYQIVCTIGVSIPGGYLLVGAPSLLTIGIYYILLYMCSFYGRKFCNEKTILCGMIVLGFSVFGNRLIFHKNTVAFLDVGQGDSTVISTYDGRAVVIDGGGWFGAEIGKNTGMKVVKPYLEYLGVKELDGIFLTHFDSDHMIGVVELCQSVPTKAVYLSEYPCSDTEKWHRLKEVLEKQGIMLYTVKENDVSNWGNYGEITCFYPPKGVKFIGDNDNHGSLVLKYQYGGTKILFTGDAAVEDERVLLAKGADISAQILKLGHHGSKNSSSNAFLDVVDPQVGIISCGKENRYGHPHEDTLKRVNEQRIAVYRTDKQGTILAEISPKGSYEMDAVAEREAVYEGIKKTMEKR